MAGSVILIELLEILAGEFVVGIKLERALVVHAGFFYVSGFGEGAPKIGFGVGVLGIQANGGAKMKKCAREVTLRG
jgi:hypothetical protein